MDLMTAPVPWDRQPGESARLFGLFVRFRDLPPSQRSLDALGRELANEAQAGRKRGAHGRLRAHARQWCWAERALAWDSEQDRVRRAKRLEEIEATEELEIRLGRAGLARLVAWLNQQDDAAIARWTPFQACKVGETFHRLLRAGLRVPEGYRGTELSGPQSGPVEIREVQHGELASLDRVRGVLDVLQEIGAFDSAGESDPGGRNDYDEQAGA